MILSYTRAAKWFSQWPESQYQGGSQAIGLVI